MKSLRTFMLLLGAICILSINSFAKELKDTTVKKPIEINMNFVMDGDNSKLEVGIVCNKTLGKKTLYSNIMKYDFKTNIGAKNWLEDYIKTQWDPSKAYFSFPTADGMTIDCKEGAIYYFEYPFKWQWESTFNSILALIYVQDSTTKEILAVERSQNVLYCEFSPIVPTPFLKISPAKEQQYQYIISNPTKDKLTYEVVTKSSNYLWELSMDKDLILLPPEGSDTITLTFKSTPREQYGTISLSVTPVYLKDMYSVPETRTITHNVITDGIEYLGITNRPVNYYNSGNPSWYSFIQNACYAQPEIGTKWVFMQYDFWKSTFPDINYKVLYIFPESGNIGAWGIGKTLEKAALECIAKGKNLIVSSNTGLSVLAKKINGYVPSKEAADFYNLLGIEYRGFINLYVPIDPTDTPVKYKDDTLSVRVEEDHDLNTDIDETNTFINSGYPMTPRIDYIGITGDNQETFPFLWFNRKNPPADAYAAIATQIGTSKIIYLSPGLESIGGVADTLLIRNFLNWMNEPSSIKDSKPTSNIYLYPNPANQYIEIQQSHPSIAGFSQLNDFVIYNSLGENVTAFVSRKVNRINTENLSVGSYYFIIRSDKQSVCLPFVIKR